MSPRPIDMAFAAIIQWLKQHGLEAHTDRFGRTTVIPRRRREARL